MTRIAITTAALLIAAGTAFAGSDKFGSDSANRPVATVDQSVTASISKPDSSQQTVVKGSNRDLFGSR
ncbi:DUF680 domain-containing protein [Mesorhizobium sp. ES1-4]|uniref:DUF680 domain-containing protein n=1 Tax=Mesorhizobium sp. ES1-4 TaxID=2876627 RepID=UPI001CCD3E02|nr:DUF680 domain-containing protein [Mesorhizobium sp. ES1-4]MBZ9796253.1 DUF680 domain-containing protein [Mesorhizobium sp. ES1-4]